MKGMHPGAVGGHETREDQTRLAGRGDVSAEAGRPRRGHRVGTRAFQAEGTACAQAKAKESAGLGKGEGLCLASS